MKVPPQAHPQNAERAMLLMVAAMLWLPGIDAIAKYLSATVPAGEVSWSRFLFQSLFLAPLVIFQGHRVQRKSKLWLHALRGTLIAFATLLFFASLAVLPLAEAISIFFVEPLILTVLCAVFLGETIGWRRISAVVVGFIGALIIIRPSFDLFGWAAVLPLGAATAFAVYLLITRKLAPYEDVAEMQFLSGLFGGLVMTVALLLGPALELPVITPVQPSAKEWLLMAAMGFIATSGHMLIVHAFKRAPAGVLAPFQYLEIISATLLGLLIFGDFPDLTTWFGVAIIIASGSYVFYRERKVKTEA